MKETLGTLSERSFKQAVNAGICWSLHKDVQNTLFTVNSWIAFSMHKEGNQLVAALANWG